MFNEIELKQKYNDIIYRLDVITTQLDKINIKELENKIKDNIVINDEIYKRNTLETINNNLMEISSTIKGNIISKLKTKINN